MSHTEIKSSRGGRRPGSGRKKLDRVSILLRISPEADQALRATAQRFDVTPSRLVEKLVLGRTQSLARIQTPPLRKQSTVTTA